MKKLLFAFALAFATRASAQVVETPEPFDSTGRVTVVTPSIAARLQLSPPAWRITGDYSGARLFALGDQGYVIVVERRDGGIERYAITRADRDYLRARTSTLPPGLLEDQLGRVGTGLGEVKQQLVTAARTDAFVFNQGALAALVYGPAFAYALSNETPGRIAAYVLGAGGTFYAATQVARTRTITPQQNFLATHAALHGAAAGLGIAYAAKGNSNVQGASAFVGGVGGSLLGLGVRGLRDSDVAGATFGADAMLLTSYLLTRAGRERSEDFPTRGEAIVLAASTVAGYPLGLQLARGADYNVTTGDVGALWTTGLVGALAAGTIAHGVVRNGNLTPGTSRYRDRHQVAVNSAAAGGFIAGAVAGDLLLARRFDHTTYEAGILAAAAGGGALMGAGAYSLIRPSRPSGSVGPYVAATVGAVGGMAIAEAFMPPRNDAGRQSAATVRVDPLGLALAAARTPGQHSVVQISF
ncbi:MAG TPA: hypothetical protein VHM30_00040 [Gemmatimonadaceae bacterium]|nr:hypothetical protein [Gemmatimonadaceae bacterium]